DKAGGRPAKPAEDVARAVNRGARWASLAAQRVLKAPPSPPPLRRPDGVNAKLQTTPPVLVAKLFEAKPDDVVIAADAAGSYVAQLGEVQIEETPPTSALADLSRDLNQGMRTDLAVEYTQALRARFPVDIRREAVDRLF